MDNWFDTTELPESGFNRPRFAAVAGALMGAL
jgi:hypothetical protein